MTQTSTAVDWMWCYEHPKEAAAEIERLRGALVEIRDLAATTRALFEHPELSEEEAARLKQRWDEAYGR